MEDVDGELDAEVPRINGNLQVVRAGALVVAVLVRDLVLLAFAKHGVRVGLPDSEEGRLLQLGHGDNTPQWLRRRKGLIFGGNQLAVEQLVGTTMVVVTMVAVTLGSLYLIKMRYRGIQRVRKGYEMKE